MPIKPNRKTRITNQLRLNSKALFNPSLKDHQPIVIEDEDTEEDISGFANMLSSILTAIYPWLNTRLVHDLYLKSMESHLPMIDCEKLSCKISL
jgi:hypothetical protein